MTFDSYEYTINGVFASPMINGDYSGLTDDEAGEFATWLLNAVPEEHRGTGHWDGFDEEDRDYRRCEVTGSYGECFTVRYVFPIR